MCDPESLSWCVFARPHQDFISKSWNYRRRGEINDLSELLHGIDSESMVEPIRHPCVPMAGTAVFERFHFESKLWESAAKFRSGHLAIVSEEPIREPIFDGVGMWTPPQKQPKPVAKVRRVWDLDHQQPPGAQQTMNLLQQHLGLGYVFQDIKKGQQVTAIRRQRQRNGRKVPPYPLDSGAIETRRNLVSVPHSIVIL